MRQDDITGPGEGLAEVTGRLTDRLESLTALASRLDAAWDDDRLRRLLLERIAGCSRLLAAALGDLARGLPPTALEMLDDLMEEAAVRHAGLLVELDEAVA